MGRDTGSALRRLASVMRRCDCGSRRPALRDQGWHDYPDLDDQPIVIIVGADPRECG
jgi:hypothetical protein